MLAERRVKVQKELAEIDELYKRDIEDDDEEDAAAELIPELELKVSIRSEVIGEQEKDEQKIIVNEKHSSSDEMETNGRQTTIDKANQSEENEMKEDSLIDTKSDENALDVKEAKDEGQEGLEEKEFEPIYDE
jgi:hypothetical protein